MSGSAPPAGKRAARNDAWDRDCTGVSGVLFLVGGLTAALRGQAQLGEVCTLLGGVFLAVAARLWVVPRERRGGGQAAAGEPVGGPQPGAAGRALEADTETGGRADRPGAGTSGASEL